MEEIEDPNITIGTMLPSPIFVEKLGFDKRPIARIMLFMPAIDNQYQINYCMSPKKSLRKDLCYGVESVAEV